MCYFIESIETFGARTNARRHVRPGKHNSPYWTYWSYVLECIVTTNVGQTGFNHDYIMTILISAHEYSEFANMMPE